MPAPRTANPLLPPSFCTPVPFFYLSFSLAPRPPASHAPLPQTHMKKRGAHARTHARTHPRAHTYTRLVRWGTQPLPQRASPIAQHTYNKILGNRLAHPFSSCTIKSYIYTHTHTHSYIHSLSYTYVPSPHTSPQCKKIQDPKRYAFFVGNKGGVLQ
jgi:hypothetical protein